MKTYILFQRCTFGEGDCVVAVSTNKRKIVEVFKEKREEIIEDKTFVIEDESETSFFSTSYDGELYELEIQEHETLK